MENTIDKTKNWIKNSISLKLIIITFLMLLLLIPSSMIISIIQERENLNGEVTEEVSSKWANSQTMNGPIVTIPLEYEYEKDKEVIYSTKYWHILPENLKINGEIQPESLSRGIYEVVVYKAELDITGSFTFDQHLDSANLKEIKYDQAFLTLGVSDPRGIRNQINFKWNDRTLNPIPGSRTSMINSGITLSIPNLSNNLASPASFKCEISLQGSKNLSFIPAGRRTDVQVNSPWNSPSFNGNFLPDFREVGEDGFTASWKILEINRNFPSSWVSSDYSENLKSAVFGVDFVLPMDDYQKSMRSAKYAMMTIALTFLIFFLVEILNKRKIHPFQYVLVGLALCLFYILLVSITEHTNFNVAYAVSTFAIVTMIALYSTTIFKKPKLSLLLTLVLLGCFGFLFITLQLADYALIMGSAGLTIALCVTMYYTRSVNWYHLN